MRHVTLIANTDDTTGELGLTVEGLHVEGDAFAATEGLLIAHDLIEHQNGVEQIGSIDDELEALGALWFVRGQFGDLRRDGRGSFYTTEQSIAGDVTRMFRDYFHGGYVGPNVPRTKAHEEDDSFTCILDHAREDIPGEVEFSSLDEGQRGEYRAAFDHYMSAALARMRIGYRKAARRYGDAQKANATFWAIARAVDPHARHVEREGQQFRLSWGNREATCSEIYEEDY